MRVHKAVLGILLFFIIIPARAQQGVNMDFGGYLKELGQVSISNDFRTIRYDNVFHHRLETELDLGKGFELQADLRTRLLNGWSVRHIPGYAGFIDQDQGYLDLSFVVLETEHTLLHSASDRLHLSYTYGPWEAQIGRQRINWGKTMVWNPNDLFNAYAYLDFDYEERPGADALYFRYNWSYASSIDVGYRLGHSFDESVVAVIYRESFGQYDLQFLGGSYYRYWALGAGWSGYLRSAGFRGEFSYFHPRRDFFNKNGHFTMTTGADYMFPNSLYLSGELLYNGGWNHSGNPLTDLTRPPSADDLFIARTGYYFNASYPLNPLTSVSGGIIGSFTRPLFIFMPQMTHSLSNNLDLMVLAQILKGSVLEVLTPTPNIFYFRLKWSY